MFECASHPLHTPPASANLCLNGKLALGTLLPHSLALLSKTLIQMFLPCKQNVEQKRALKHTRLTKVKAVTKYDSRGKMAGQQFQVLGFEIGCCPLQEKWTVYHTHTNTSLVNLPFFALLRRCHVRNNDKEGGANTLPPQE